MDKTGRKAGKDYSDGMEKETKKGTKRVSGALKAGLAGVGAAVGGMAIKGMFDSMIEEASEAEQSIGATQALYGKHADKVVKKSQEAAQAVGLSANEYRNSSNLLAALFKNQGVAQDELSEKTDEMVTLGADLAAMYGGTAADAVESLTAAYKGEFNSLEKYGITLKASTVNQEAMRVANVNSAKEWNALSTEQQAAATQQATTNLLLKQSTDAQGTAAREADTYAGRMQRLKASIANVKETLGNAFLPVVSSFVGILNDNVVPAVAGFITGMQEGHGWGGKVADVFGIVKGAAFTAFDYVKQNVLPVIGELISQFKNSSGAGGLVKNTLNTLWEALQQGYAIFKNSILPVITQFYGIFKNQVLPTLQTVLGWIVNTLWPDIQRVFIYNIMPAAREVAAVIKDAFTRVILPAIEAMWRFIKNTLWPFIEDFYQNGIKPTFKLIGDVISGAWKNVIKPTLQALIDFTSKIPAAFTKAKDGIANAWDSIRKAVATPIVAVVEFINKHFIGNFNKVVKPFNGGKNVIPEIAVPKIPVGRTTSGRTTGRTYGSGAVAYAVGGKVKGYSPNPTADNIPAWLTAGEYVLPVRATDQLRNTIGDQGLESLRRGQLPGYAGGGLVEHLWERVKGAGAWTLKNVSSLFTHGKRVWNELIERTLGNIPGGSLGTIGVNVLKSVAGKVGESLRKLLGGGSAGGKQSVNYGGNLGWAPRGLPWPMIWGMIKAVAPEAVMTSNYRPGAITASGYPSLHGQGRAVDIVSGNMANTFMKIRGLLPWSQLFHSPMGNLQYGYRDAIVHRDHFDHIHAAFASGGLVPNLYDNGGLLQPGVSLVANKTNKPEAVLTGDQWNRLTSGGGNTIVINGVDTNQTTAVADELLFALKRTGRGKYNRRR